MVNKMYKVAHREAKNCSCPAKAKANEDLYKKLDSNERANDICRIAKTRERIRRGLGNIKYIKDEGGRTIVIEDDSRKRRGGYFSPLFIERIHEGNGEVESSSQNWNFDCYFSRIKGEVMIALQKMGRNKAVRLDQILMEASRSDGGRVYVSSSSIGRYGAKIKIALVQLEASKKNGGLGVSSFHALNSALLLKWVRRFISQDGSLWFRVIQALYGPSIVSHPIGDKSLQDLFSRLFALELDKEVLVADKMKAVVGHSFRRPGRAGSEHQQMVDLNSLLESVSLSQFHDRWFYDLTGDGEFRVKK
nr:RNA-directed DNA polymerase, eukaryota, reverse transcriptase zinc-binding domain protein [Tanacetum cinerariifolium]